MSGSKDAANCFSIREARSCAQRGKGGGRRDGAGRPPGSNRAGPGNGRVSTRHWSTRV